MANSVIINYLNDTSVPKDVRSHIAEGLNSGDLSEKSAMSGITTKYGNKYGSSPSNPLSGLVDNVKQHGLQGAALDLAGGAGKNIANAMIEGGKSMTPQEVQDNNARSQEFEKNDQAATLQKQKKTAQGPIVDTLNSALGAVTGQSPFMSQNPDIGIASNAVETGKNAISAGLDVTSTALKQPSTFNQVTGLDKPLNQVADTLSQASNAVGGEGGHQVVPALQEGVQKVKQGAQKLYNTASQGGGIPGGVTPLSDEAISGTNDILGGGQQALFSPANVLPDTVKQGMAVPFKAASDEAAKGLQALGIDPNSVQGKNLLDTFNNALQIGVGIYGGRDKAPIGEGVGESMVKPNEVLPNTLQNPPTSLPATPEQISKNLLRSGVKENYVNGLSNLSPELRNLGSQYLEAGINKLRDPINAPNVFDIPGKEIEDFIGQGSQKLKNIGEQLGLAKENLAGKPLETTPIQNTLNDVFKKLNIKQTADGLDFSKSELNGAGGVTSQLESIWNQVKQDTMDARDAEAITGQIDNMTGQLKSSGFNSNTANRALSTVKSAINESLGKADENFGNLNKQFANLSQDLQQVKNATGVKLGNGKTEYNGQQLLRRLQGNAPVKYAETLDAMNRIESNHGIEAPKNLQEKAFLADMAEKYTGSNQPQALQGAVEKGTEIAKNSAVKGFADIIPGGKIIHNIFESATDYLNPENRRILENQANNLKDVLTKEIKPGKAPGTFTISKKGLEAITQTLGAFTNKAAPIAAKVNAGSKK